MSREQREKVGWRSPVRNQLFPIAPDEIVVDPESVDFGGKAASVEVHEEKAKIEKQAVVREEVNIHKEVEHDTIEAAESLRREELEIDTNSDSIIEK